MRRIAVIILCHIYLWKMQMREHATKQYLLGLASLAIILLGPASGIVTGESASPPFYDPKNDLFDKDGKVTTAEPYLDIISVDVRRSGLDYVMELVLDGVVPRSIDPSLWIQWGIYIDIDNNPSTGSRSPLVYNDIGADYHIRLGIRDSTYYSDIRTMPNRQAIAKARYSIEDNRIAFVVGPPEIGLPATPLSVVAVIEKWSNRGQPPDTYLLAADKAPDIGHCTIYIGTTATSMETRTTSSSIQIGSVISSDNKYFDLMFETDHFKIYFHTADAEFANSLVRAAEDAYPILLRVYGEAPPSKTVVFLFLDFEEATKLGFRSGAPSPTNPDFPAGEFNLAAPLGDGVRLCFPTKDKILNSLAKDMIAHETGHRFLRLIYPRVRAGTSSGIYPRWVNEGFSVYVGTEFSQQFQFLEAVLQAAKRETLPTLTLDTLDKVESSSSRLYYGLASTVLYHISAKYGEQSLKQLLAEWNRGATMADGIKQVLGVSYSDLEQAWINRIRDLTRQAKDGTEFYYLLTGNAPPKVTSMTTDSSTAAATSQIAQANWLQTVIIIVAGVAAITVILVASVAIYKKKVKQA